MCDAWVCTLWKAGGLFGSLKDEVQCTESTNWDILTLPFFAKVCKTSSQNPLLWFQPDPACFQLLNQGQLTRFRAKSFRVGATERVMGGTPVSCDAL